MKNELTDYYQAARFPGLDTAGAIYIRLQEMVYEAQDDIDLSVYRLKIADYWHVVVLGEKPSEEFHIRIQAELTNGVLVTLGDDYLRYLQDRRAKAIQLGPWVERHYPPPQGEK